ENVVADTLSKVDCSAELNAFALSTVTSGHSGTNVTSHKIGTLFYWRGMCKGVKRFIRECDTCQRQKPDLSAYPGYLQPLLIPEKVWSEISMNFITGLPKSQGKSVILVVVDRLSKYAHFMALSHPYTASSVAQVFLDSVYKLHGLPSLIMSDRDAVFLSNFWQSLFKLLKVHLKMSTAYHPKIDGQTEVYLKLQPHRQVTIRQEQQHKLSAKYYGPFMILAKVGKVAYKLEFLSTTVLDRRMAKLNNKAVVYVLVKWVNHNEEDATWELYDLVQRFPEF
ncbi:putative mitochondrial protein, partial [Tanacetum coccineum]